MILYRAPADGSCCINFGTHGWLITLCLVAAFVQGFLKAHLLPQGPGLVSTIDINFLWWLARPMGGYLWLPRGMFKNFRNRASRLRGNTPSELLVYDTVHRKVDRRSEAFHSTGSNHTFYARPPLYPLCGPQVPDEEVPPNPLKVHS